MRHACPPGPRRPGSCGFLALIPRRCWILGILDLVGLGERSCSHPGPVLQSPQLPFLPKSDGSASPFPVSVPTLILAPSSLPTFPPNLLPSPFLPFPLNTMPFASSSSTCPLPPHSDAFLVTSPWKSSSSPRRRSSPRTSSCPLHTHPCPIHAPLLAPPLHSGRVCSSASLSSAPRGPRPSHSVLVTSVYSPPPSPIAHLCPVPSPSRIRLGLSWSPGRVAPDGQVWPGVAAMQRWPGYVTRDLPRLRGRKGGCSWDAPDSMGVAAALRPPARASPGSIPPRWGCT